MISTNSYICFVIIKTQQPGDCNLRQTVVRLRSIPFALKDLAKKWLYSLTVDLVSTWDDFVKVFLKKFYPIRKTSLIRKNIMQFKHKHNEPFWKYFERFKDLLAQCLHHDIEKWRQCQILYDGLATKTPLKLWSRRILKERRGPRMGFIWILSWKNNPVKILLR